MDINYKASIAVRAGEAIAAKRAREEAAWAKAQHHANEARLASNATYPEERMSSDEKVLWEALQAAHNGLALHFARQSGVGE